MYLEHFGLERPPFKITPVTDFFFPGANRAEILEALLYAITESEGIIKITGEVGSGKTMLCRMLLEQLPEHIEAVYLANPSLSRDEMLYAIADGLKLDLEGQRVNIFLQTLQNHLELKTTQGKRVVILVDEAHAMPLDTMEELRLLYNLQVGNHKLLHIVLFGQPELNDKLSQPNMRQLKDRIVHHFSMLPLLPNIIESYLIFRMRTAGYRGPNPFTKSASTLIGKASQGLMRRVNILADKALLAAFVDNTHSIESRHVHAAIRDTELTIPVTAWWKRKNTILAVSVGLLLIAAIAATAWYDTHTPAITDIPQGQASPAIVAGLQTTPTPPEINIPQKPAQKPAQTDKSDKTTLPINTVKAQALSTSRTTSLLMGQRVAAAKALQASNPAGSASIQLYYTYDMQATRIEGFLQRANKLGKLNDIYVLPFSINQRNGYRVLFGIFADSAQAQAQIQHLPPRYLDAFEPTVYVH